MKLSEHFDLSEFCTSQTAARIGRSIEPTQSDITNLRRLCVMVLEPLRIAIGPVTITSGLRPDWLNTAIGGSKTSAHTDARAADIRSSELTPLQVCEAVQRLQLPVDQCIHEFPPNGWCHVSIARAGEAIRNQYLTARVINGRTVYAVGVSA